MHILRTIAFYIFVSLGLATIFLAIGSIDSLVKTSILTGVSTFIVMVLGGGFLVWLGIKVDVAD